MEGKKLIEKYTVESDGVTAGVAIWNVLSENVPVYDLTMPEIGPATEAVMGEVIDELCKVFPLEIEDVRDPKKLEAIKQGMLTHTKEAVKKMLPNLEEEKVTMISGIMLHRMIGLGFIELILADNNIEELAVNAAHLPVHVYHKKYGWCQTTKSLGSEEETLNFSSQIGRKVGREINSLHPIMDAHLITGDRVASTLFPITTAGNTITIRRFSRNPWTIVHLISPEYHTLSVEMAALLWLALQYELNILVAGGTASGKTSILNAISILTPPSHRIISIEDTREITLPKELSNNWVPMTTRNANPEGQGEVSMLDLMVSSLRMRPDRIIVGEVRRREQAETLFEAMHTGHSVYTTLHADTVEQVKRRLVEAPMSIPKTELEALHLILVQFRDRRKGSRRTLEMAEVLRGGKDYLETNLLCRWHPRDDKFEKVNASIRLFEDLNLHTGMTGQEILHDIKEKQAILEWMLAQNIKDIGDVGKVMRIYYKDKTPLLEAVKNKKPLPS